MIKKIRYKNFKALLDTTLPLGRFTLIVGANGTGKTTALDGLKVIERLDGENWTNFLTKGLLVDQEEIEIQVFWDDFSYRRIVGFNREPMNHLFDNKLNNLGGSPGSYLGSLSSTYSHTKESQAIKSFEVYSFDSDIIAESVSVSPNVELAGNGKNLAGVLDQLRDSEPEKFEDLNEELKIWFPEFDRILFEVPFKGEKTFLLRTIVGNHKIRAEDLSDGTRLALAYLTIAYLPNPPKIVAFEEPEKGIHPRLLANIQEAMYRLAYPENYGIDRDPVQVIATTHSPYLLDLYKDHPEEIVIANKDDNGVHFERIIDKPHYKEVLQDAPLGEIWYTGILGGVPTTV